MVKWIFLQVAVIKIDLKNLLRMLKCAQNQTEGKTWQLQGTRVVSLWLSGLQTFPNPQDYDWKKQRRTSLVVEWLRICLSVLGTLVQTLVWEDPMCCRATKPMCHIYWACALEPSCCNYCCRHTIEASAPQEKLLQWEACTPQLECSSCLLQPEKAHVQQWRPSATNK